MSNWSLFVEESGGDFPSGATSVVPRPNEDLDVGKMTTQVAVQLADGSVGYITPENKSNNTIPGTKYFALIGTGINSKANSALGNIKAKATNKP